MEYDKEIRRLLGLYFEGETTLGQEKELREFFSGENVPADLEHMRPIFAYFTSSAASCMQKEINPPSAGNTSDMPGRVGGNVRSGKKPARRLGWLYGTVSVAAAIAITLLITIKVSDGRDKVLCYVDGYAVTDAELASRQADMAVRILEGNLKASTSGLEIVGKAGKSIEKAFGSATIPKAEL